MSRTRTLRHIPGYPYLMRIGHAINVLTQYTTALFKTVRRKGLRRFIEFERETLSAPWLDAEEVRRRLQAPYQLRLD